ncbi:MAG: RNA-binding S4 domain-containing protein [Bacteroidales bacterium]|nr:RNA-binding S4 domain-containing protein [Bacteroidales bacterium]
MTEEIKVRLDKWLWAVRIYKTRNQASEACRKGRILVNGMEAKASREIRVDDIVIVRKLPVIHTYKVLALIEHRQPAKIIRDFMEDLTSVEELNKHKVNESFFVRRDRGKGRPTKKERRTLDNMINNIHK